MPSTLLSVGLVIFGFSLIAHGENHRLVSGDDLFAYIVPASEDQEQIQFVHPDSRTSLNTQYNINSQDALQSSDPSLRSNGLYSKPPSLPESRDPRPLFSSLHEGLRTGILTEDKDSDDGGDGGSKSSDGFGPLDKRNEVGERMKVLRSNVRDRYRRIFRPNAPPSLSWPTQEIKRERNNPDSTLSVDSSLNVIRHLFLQKLRRQQFMEKQRQIQSNGEMLSNIGKRDVSHSSVGSLS